LPSLDQQVVSFLMMPLTSVQIWHLLHANSQPCIMYNHQSYCSCVAIGIDRAQMQGLCLRSLQCWTTLRCDPFHRQDLHQACSVLCSNKLSHRLLRIPYASEHGTPITLDPPLVGSSITKPNRTSVSIALSIGISIFALNFSYMNCSHVSLMLARDDTWYFFLHSNIAYTNSASLYCCCSEASRRK